MTRYIALEAFVLHKSWIYLIACTLVKITHSWSKTIFYWYTRFLKDHPFSVKYMSVIYELLGILNLALPYREACFRILKFSSVFCLFLTRILTLYWTIKSHITIVIIRVKVDCSELWKMLVPWDFCCDWRSKP